MMSVFSIYIYICFEKKVIYKPYNTQHFWFHWLFLSSSQPILLLCFQEEKSKVFNVLQEEKNVLI